MPAVTVNLNVNVNADSDLSILTSTADSVASAVVCVDMPAAALSGLIEFWEPSDALGTIKAQVIDSYKTTAFALYDGLDKVINGSMDCSAAPIYSTYTDTNYTTVSSFGKLALGYVAHSIFGHVQATAAITNDVAFVTNMNSSIVPSNANEMLVEDNYVQSASNANLAMALVKALNNQTDANLATIATTVIGQDSGRARAADNSELPTDLKQPLAFFTGDVVFVSITVNAPTISSLGGTAYDAAGTGNAITTIASQKFDLKITLK
jgi:hypothetical protein